MLEIFKTCFSTNLNEYDNIGIDLEINKVLVVAFSAMMVGIIFFNLYRQNIKAMVSQLVRHGAKSEDCAKTLGALGLNNSRIIKNMLLGNNLLTKIVARKGEVRYEYSEYKALSKEEKRKALAVDLDTAEFYIREDKFTLADGVVARYGTSVINTLIACLFTAIICVCLIACMPGILNVINNMLG